jgi:hypothetical protein
MQRHQLLDMALSYCVNSNCCSIKFDLMHNSGLHKCNATERIDIWGSLNTNNDGYIIVMKIISFCLFALYYLLVFLNLQH